MNNKLPKYDKYKPSGVEWLGEIPEHWEVKRLKDICQINRKSLPENTNKNFSFEYVDIGSVNFEKGIINTETFIFKNAPSRARRIAEIGDTIISTVRTYLKAIDYIGDSKDKYIYSTGFAILTPKETHSKYLSMAVKSDSFTNQVDIFSTGMSYPAINSTELGRLKIAIPPLSEQEKIAQFLDRKTAQIDQAIGIKEKQIALLKERRQLMIHRAVTKGLNHDSKDLPDYHDFNNTDNPVILQSSKSRFRHSGVEWIGEIPEHWGFSKAKFYSKVFVPERAKPDLNTNNDGFPWVTTEHLRNKELLITDVKYYVSDTAKNKTGSRTIKANSVIATCVGNFGIASKLNFECIINQQVQGFTDLKINADYLTYLIGISEDYFKNNSTLTTIMYVSKDTFGSLPIPLPPIEEQKQIVTHIETLSSKIATAISLKEQEIAKLKEYKSVLINGAVTGKVKVG